MKPIMKYSRHELDIVQWQVERALSKKRYDAVYFHYGSLINDPNTQRVIRSHPELIWIAGVLGPRTISNWMRGAAMFHDVVYLMDAITVTSKTYYDLIRKRDPSVLVYFCHLGVDTETFHPAPPPKHFTIGWAGTCNRDIANWDGDFGTFIRLPFPKRTATIGKGTQRPFKDMPAFYHSISLLVDAEKQSRPGGLMFLEAGACGRPVIVMKSGVQADWIPTEWRCDDYDDMVKKIQRLHDDPELYHNVCDEYLRRARSRSHQAVAKEYDAMFDELEAKC
jgi:glycosyltransferase involved in cell wall biosynthesis